jgi:hypothetical protein
MNKGIGAMVKSVILALGFMLVLGSQACKEKKLDEQAPGKALESAAPTTGGADSSASATSTADESSREGAPAGGSK